MKLFQTVFVTTCVRSSTKLKNFLLFYHIEGVLYSVL